LGAGWVAAHGLSYTLLVPHADRGELLAQTGHGYFRPSDLLVLCAIIATAGLVVVLVGGSALKLPKPKLLALLPPIGFVVQEHVERMVPNGAFPAHLVTEPPFLLGLILQVPFALLALACAVLLVSAANRLGRALRAPARATPLETWRRTVLSPFLNLPRRAALAAGCSERGPPFSLS
jgi:hypothetical protein